MPFIIPIIVAAAAFITANAVVISTILTVVSLATTFASMLLKATAAGQSRQFGITRQVREPAAARRIVYGERRVSGPIAFIGTTDDTKYLHMIIMLASHEIEAIDEVLLDDYPIYDSDLDVNGLVDLVDSRYEGLVRIKKHLGDDAQTVDSDLVAEAAEWTSNHRLRGIAYVYVRLEHDQDVFPNSIPNVSAYVRGKKVLDTRDGVTRWSPNAVLVWRDYVSSSTIDGGAGFAAAEIDDSFVDAAANVCEEFVATASVAHSVASVDTAADTMDIDTTILKFQRGDRIQVTSSGTIPAGLAAVTDYFVVPVQRFGSDDHSVKISLATTFANAVARVVIDITGEGTGNITLTRNAEPRYMASGVVQTDETPVSVIPSILSAMAARASYAGGVWKVLAGAFTAPTIGFDEGDLRGPLDVSTQHSRRERLNAVRGGYSSPLFVDVPTDYPPVTNSTYETADNGERLFADLDQTFVTRAGQAQRLAKIELEKHRQAISVRCAFSLKAMQVQAGDTIQLSNTNLGWTDKEFDVVEWKLAVADFDGALALVVEMTLREIASAVYDWSLGEETTQDPAPDTTLPNPFSVANPTGLAVSTDEFITESGTRLHYLHLSWTEPMDGFVTNGGKIEIQFKKSADADFQQSYFVDGNVTEHVIPAQVQFGINYDMQIRSVNSLGARQRPAAYTQLFGFTAGAESGGATAQFDDGLARDPVTEFIDMGGGAEAADLFLDDGTAS